LTTTSLSPRAAVALGLVIIGAGLFLVLFAVGLVPGAEASLEAPRWVAACAGLMFALCGGAAIMGYAVAGGVGPDGDLPAGTPRRIRLTQYVLGLGIISSLAAIATWIAFGPGPRAFTVTLLFVGRRPRPRRRNRRAGRLRSRRGADVGVLGRVPAGQRPAASPKVATPIALSPASTCRRRR
jgi:hypothetical protein